MMSNQSASVKDTFHEMLSSLSLKNSESNMSGTSVRVHSLSENPTKAWEKMRKKQKVLKVDVTVPSEPPGRGVLRFVCMSDTHNTTSRLPFDIPEGDVFVHAGDFTRTGDLKEVKHFDSWLGTLPHKYKVVIAGNHELSFDPERATRSKRRAYLDAVSGSSTNESAAAHGERSSAEERTDAWHLITSATYLQDDSLTICGVNIYGSPWQPEFFNWAFNLPRGDACLSKWDRIPSNTDILITHGPPVGHGDLCSSGRRAGCVELLTTIQERVKPHYHIFGHIHEGYGVTTDGTTTYVNASTCDIRYRPVNPAIVIDFPIPSGFIKD